MEAGDDAQSTCGAAALQTQPPDLGAGQAGSLSPWPKLGTHPSVSSSAGLQGRPPRPDICADFHRVFKAPRKAEPGGLVRIPPWA